MAFPEHTSGDPSAQPRWFSLTPNLHGLADGQFDESQVAENELIFRRDITRI
jgi:hypothetical protein